jgi:hypothetical protein
VLEEFFIVHQLINEAPSSIDTDPGRLGLKSKGRQERWSRGSGAKLGRYVLMDKTRQKLIRTNTSLTQVSVFRAAL